MPEFRTLPDGSRQDEVSTYRMSGTNSRASGDQQITHNCVEGEVTTVPPTTAPPTTAPPTVQGTEVARGTTLPRTGTGTAGLSATAGLLLVIGGLLMALANRPMPTFAAASTRSRGR